jgi:hypothetical protein
MNTHKFIPILLVLPLAAASLACPTRNVDGDNSGSGGTEMQTGGHGGAIQTESGTGGSTGVAGASGALGGAGAGGTVVAGTGGVAGATGTGGAAGVTATGGVAGATETGGVTGATGTGGVVGTGGATGTGGSPPTCSPACSSSTQTCVGTSCLLNDGQSCSVASQCVSNKCTPFFVDQDGDGYGTGQAAGFCGTTAPVGYAAQNGDCCDTATNIAVAKLIHPGAGFQTVSAGVCNISWDYNCSGAVEVDPTIGMGECASGTSYPTCANVSTPYPVTDCGTTVYDSRCGQYSTDKSNACAVEGGPATLGCR